MDPSLVAFLEARAPLAHEAATWGDLNLEIHYYASDERPPDHLVTSARAIVLTPEQVLVVHDPSGEDHVVPGGRRQSGESLEDTVRREVLEETGWTIADLSFLAVARFHIIGPVPDGYPYPHPDFLQVIYLAQPLHFREGYDIEDDWVTSSEMLPVTSLSDCRLSDVQRRLLEHAIRRARAVR